MPQEPTPARKLLRIYGAIGGMFAALLIFAAIAHFAGGAVVTAAAALALRAFVRRKVKGSAHALPSEASSDVSPLSPTTAGGRCTPRAGGIGP